jgi:hypothetical protein
MDTDAQNSDEFLTEVSYQFERDLDLRKNLDSKSTDLITKCSTIITIIVSIGFFLITKILSRNEIFYLSVFILTGGIILAFISISFLTRAYGLRTYRYPMGHEQFFKNGLYDLDMSEKFRKTEKQKFIQHILREYFESIRVSSQVMSEKSAIIKNGQNFFYFALLSVCVLLISILVTFGLGWIELNLSL